VTGVVRKIATSSERGEWEAMTGDRGAVSAAQERVRVFEPEPGWTLGGHPMLNGLLEVGRRRVRRNLVVFPPVIAVGVAVALLEGQLFGVLPLVLIGGLGLAGWGLQLFAYFYSIRPTYGLRNAPFFEARPDEILVSGRKVSFRVPGDRWLVVKLGPAQRVLLARVRRMWLVGPDAVGRVGMLLPGMVNGAGGRLRAEPAPGSVALAALSREPVAPKDDPVLAAYFRSVARRNVISTVVLFATAGYLVWSFAGLQAPDDAGDFAVGLLLGLAGAIVVLGCWSLVVLYRLNQAITVPNWTELGIRLDSGIQTNGGIIANAAGRVLLPDGREVAVTLGRVNVSLLLTVETTGRLWVLGTPRPGNRAYAGLPGYPLVSVVKFGE
jgi:hypothetical protein